MNLRRIHVAFTAVMVAAVAGAGINFSARERAATEDESPLRLVLNVPANRIYVYENGVKTKSYRVSVGQKQFQTPAGNYTIRSAVWNPWWHPPESEWARDEKPTPPGWSNPMGRVKLNFTELYYIHGTPQENEQDLGLPASHGCVRMANRDALELAQLVHKYAAPNLAASDVQKLVENPQATRQVRFSTAVPFDVVYSVAIVRDDFLIIYPDVYSKVGTATALKEQVREVLAEAGVDPDNVNTETLDRLVKKGLTMRVAAPLNELASASTVAAGANEQL